MFNYWPPQPNPTDIFSQWQTMLGMPQNTVPPVYTQLQEFGNAFHSFLEVFQKQSIGAEQLPGMDQMLRHFSANPLLQPFMSTQPMSQMAPWLQQSNIQTDFLQLKQPPALGISREWQEDWTLLLEYQRKYDEALKSYSRIFQNFTQNATERFIKSSTKLDDKAGFDFLCRKWIDSCEEEFQKIAATSEYTTAFARVINCYVRVLQQNKKIQEKVARLQSQPTRSELDALHRKVADKSAEIDLLNATVQELKHQIREIKKPKKRNNSSTAKTKSSK